MSRASAIASSDTIPLRYLVDINPSVDFSGLGDDTEVTFLPMDRVKSGYLIPNTDRLSKLASSYNSFENGDIVLAKVTPCFENGNIAITDNLTNGKGFGSSELFVIRPNGIEQRFLFYCLQSGLFKQEGEASMTGAGGLKRISADVLRRHRVHAFPRQSQHRIATYLDRETARIDDLVAEKERMLSLLEQKRAALISRAVTRGLNRKAPTKASGLDWLGEIPMHWKLERSKRYFIERDQRSETGEEEMLTVSHITGVTPRSEKEVNMFEAESNEGYKLVSPDQLVINTLWAWMGAMGVSRHEGLVSPAYHAYRIAEGLLPAYVDLLVRIPAFKAEVIRFSKGVWSSRLRLYPEGLHQIWIPVPPLDEQEAIISHIQAHQTRSAALETVLRDSTALLKERRSALITAAVTGRINPATLSE